MDVIPAPGLVNGVEWLVNVTDKMDQKLERLAPSRERLLRVTQDPGKLIDLCHHAVVFRAVFRFISG